MKKLIVTIIIITALFFNLTIDIRAAGGLAPSSGTASLTGDAAVCIANGGIWIAIGCVDTTPIGVLTRIVQTGLGVMSGVALIQLIIAGLMYMKGDKKGIEDAKSKVTATITGIAVLIFSVLILRIIGVNVLDILPPGLF